MDNANVNLYNINKSVKGVIDLVPVVAPLKQDEKQSHSSGKTAMDIRKKRGVRTLAGKRLAELYKEGK
ncbi:hypothetical protein [Metabacillus malikii]|uniref:Uncharacterized protein n=1 Tax=Metabacillus malikii TaxID=1504265 RepID=A0ABT9ZPB5_9BACI|nr:hypothetical protein [Metabacillus malikii]MDQ0233075.1 hypothetical protein [Metabacillus malikii]